MRSEIECAKTILVPLGLRYEIIAPEVFEEFGIEFPALPDELGAVRYDGYDFRKVDDFEIPRLIEEGAGDIGFTGLDICTEYRAAIRFRSFGEPFAFFDVVAGEGTIDQARKLLKSNEEIPVYTKYPKLLGSSIVSRDITLVPVDDEMQELSAKIINIKETGNSVLRLRELRPVIVWRDENMNEGNIS